MSIIQKLSQSFEAKYNRSPEGFVRAPGRVNLIGEHTDYNDGFVLPIAIERETVAAFAKRDDAMAHVASLQQQEDSEFPLDKPLSPGKPKWANYCKGIAAGLVGDGVDLQGLDMLFTSDVPIGGGLSSSASLEVATALAMLRVADTEIDGYELARLCQKAEHEYAGTPCGIMDQAISVLGQQGHALLLDCRDGSIKQVPFDDPGLVVLVADTQVKHDLTDGGYAARREQCYVAATKLGVGMLREADAQMVETAAKEGKLTEEEQKRARHVVGEIDRTLRAVDALQRGDFVAFGELMYGSHASLRDDYEVSCDELDAIVEIARGCDGVYGARMTGGGFGGCAIVLAQASRAEAITETLRTGFVERFGRACPIFATRAAAGAGIVEG